MATDTVILMQRVKDATADLAFSVEFPKARERDRDNRADFEPVTMRLINDAWEQGDHLGDGADKPTPNEKTMLNLLADSMPHGLTLAAWNDKGREAGIGTSRRAALTDARQGLKRKKLVHEYADRWFVT